MARPVRDQNVRFDAMYTRGDGCWEWTGLLNKGGYGLFSVRGADGRWQHRLAHRFAFYRAQGTALAVPEKWAATEAVMHSCDNRKCVNPAHLSLGTVAANLADARNKGRMVYGARHSETMRRVAARGEHNGNAKLTREQALEILAAGRRGETQRAIATRFHVGQGHVSDIINGKRWAELHRVKE